MAIRRSPKGQDDADFQDAGGGSSLQRPALPGLAGDISHLPGGGPGIGGGEGGGTAGGMGRGGFGPRENVDQSAQGGNATLRRPTSPTPMAGSAFEAEAPRASAGVGVQPFSPMGSPAPGQMAGIGQGISQGIGGLFGSTGGLKGGGLGVPLSPLGDSPNGDISGILQLLMQLKGGG